MPTSDLAGSSSFTIAEILAKLGPDGYFDIWSRGHRKLNCNRRRFIGVNLC